ncbi:sigma-70 family RNA polymerase sigma factor [Paracoccus albus]|uniref:sigma-70 family RNA polymerase sigma factor n=1 Tax=Paracoccus albus TaxID=3017784 RepID=UPI0022F0A6C9|nr:sigma-70 family RNA polymerase sigma factor [Paracoccus albus]WBU60919.1 sigma-70 family RNA polymerase sigma factor [Paracoccus albus]
MDEAEVESLMRAGLSGDAVAYRSCLTALVPVLRRMARRALPDGARHLSEDVVQETLLVIHMKRASWDQGRPLMAWVRVILRHKAIDMLRRQKGGTHIPVETMAEILPAPDAPDPLAGHLLEQLLNRLAPRDAALIRAHALQGRDEVEIGSAFSLSPGAFRVALHRALGRLRSVAQKENEK